MISPDSKFGTEKNKTKCGECFNDGQKLFLDHHIVVLGTGELAAEKCNWAAVLFNNGTELKVGCAGFDVKGLIGIGIGE
jgi:hypothetical protein